MPAISGNVGAVFNGGTISSPLQVDPTDNTLTALRIDMPAGAAANAADWIDVRSETVGHRLEADAAGNFLVDARPTGQIRFTDNTPANVFTADGTAVTVGAVGDTQPLTLLGSALHVGGAGVAVGFYGANPVALQTGVAVTIAAVHAALVNLGLITA